jgi:beta-lactamase regulating signal transducer with metallopeptidase domain
VIASRLAPFVHWLVDLYLLSTVLLLVGLALLHLFKQPSRRMAVAQSVAAGLAALVILATAPGWPRIAAFEWPSGDPAPLSLDGTPATVVETPSATAAAPDTIGATMGRSADVLAEASPARAELAEPEKALSQLSLPSWQSIVAIAFTSGAAINLAWLALGAIQAGRLRRSVRAATPRLEPLLARISADQEHAPRVGVSTRIGLPVAIGMVRPMIVLPESFVQSEPDDCLEAALAHEWAHIRNGDLSWLALLRLLNVVLFAQPLFWWLRRTIRSDQEALADAAASALHGDGRLAYAETLLGWARSSHRRQTGALASAALALWERPSMLHRRVRLLLDRDYRVEPATTRRWKLTTACLGLLGALMLSMVTLRPVVATAQDMKAASKESRPAGTASSGAEAPGDRLEYGGRVVDPDGKPFSGAGLHLAYHGRGPDAPVRVRTTSDAAGRFQFVVARGDLDPVREPADFAQVVATADGFGPGWENTFTLIANGPKPDSRNLTIRLARDDVPISGRFVDLEGRPLPGVTIQPDRILEAKNGDLSPWISASKSGNEGMYENEQNYLDRSLWNAGGKASRAVTTDADGRFTITGVGRERVVEVKYSGPTVTSKQIGILTRDAQPLVVTLARRSPDWGKWQFYGARFEHAAAPTKPVTGVVKDKDTGHPLAGVKIAASQRADSPLDGPSGIEATTDHDGRYSLVGLPKGSGNRVIVIPAKGQPYLASSIVVPDTPALDPVVLDIGLRRGVVIEGRVTDKETGKPVRAVVEYNAFRDNPHLADAPGYERAAIWEQYLTEPDGTYRVVGLPGRGLVGAQAIGVSGEYLRGIGYKGDQTQLIGVAVPHNTPWLFNALAEIDAPKDDSTFHCDLAMERGLTQTVRVVDPDGHPVAHAMIQGNTLFSDWGSPQGTPEFQIEGLRRGEKRRVFARLKDRKFAGWLDVVAGEHEVDTLRLQPWATVLGRLVEEDGTPREHVDLVLDLFFEQASTTDSSGRFRIEGLIPGTPHDFWVSPKPAYLSGKFAKGLVLAPGELKDLGDVKEAKR